MEMRIVFEADKYKGHPLTRPLNREEAKKFVRHTMEAAQFEYDSFAEFEDDWGSIESCVNSVDEFFDIFEDGIYDEEFREETLADPKTEWVDDEGSFVASVVYVS